MSLDEYYSDGGFLKYMNPNCYDFNHKYPKRTPPYLQHLLPNPNSPRPVGYLGSEQEGVVVSLEYSPILYVKSVLWDKSKLLSQTPTAQKGTAADWVRLNFCQIAANVFPSDYDTKWMQNRFFKILWHEDIDWINMLLITDKRAWTGWAISNYTQYLRDYGEPQSLYNPIRVWGLAGQWRKNGTYKKYDFSFDAVERG